MRFARAPDIVSVMADLLCTVRGCRQALRRDRGSLRCPAGHSFDIARSGYVNLLQPQDSRSRRPGDAREIVLARQRVLDAGFESPLLETLGQVIRGLGLPGGATILDVGCGGGYFLGSLVRDQGWEGHGLDISAPALETAAKRWPGVAFAAANADRFLPYPDGSFHLVMSLTGPRNPAEFRRVLAPGGFVLLAVPGADDLVEVRAIVLGHGLEREKSLNASLGFADAFRTVSRHAVRRTVTIPPDSIRDLMAATYRAGRGSQRENLQGLGEMPVTLSRDILVLTPLA
jgi:23S rRNA (guanine745-N1)-methyltransferase